MEEIEKRRISGRVKNYYMKNPDRLSDAEKLFACLYVLYKCNISYATLYELDEVKKITTGIELKATLELRRKIEEQKKVVLSKEELAILFLLRNDNYKEIFGEEFEGFLKDITEYGDVFLRSFVDWYEFGTTYNNKLRDTVCKYYPVETYKKILCVGDGKKCHLARKLAMEGYKVVCVDPNSDKEFTCYEVKGKDNKIGSLYVTNASFFGESEDMKDWADVIVGSKIPMMVQDILESGKPSVFTVSSNAQIHKIRFNGILINSGAQLQKLIETSYKVQTIPINEEIDDDGYKHIIYISDSRIKAIEMKEKTERNKDEELTL